MKKLYALLSTILLMTFGSTNTWADNWFITFDGLVSANADIVISTTETVTIGGTEMGTCSYNDIDIDSKFVLQTGTKWLMRSGGLYQFNGGARSFGLQDCKAGQIITISASGDPVATTNVTLKSSSNGTYVYTVTEDGGVRFNPARYLYFHTISVEDPAAGNVSYTVKFVDEKGNVIKDAATYDGAPESGITLSDSDKGNITFENVTYIYLSDDAEGKTIAADGSTVVTITFRVAKDFTYKVNEVCGEATIRTTEGTNVETTNVKVPFRRYNVLNGVLYQKDAINKEYNYYFNLTEDAQEVNLAYNATETTNVVFLSEGEDIEGLTPCNTSNTGIRSSNSASAFAKDGDVAIVSLSAGTYKISAIIYDASSTHDSHWIFKAGEQQVADLNCIVVNFQELNSEEFTLTEPTTIYLAQGGGNNMGLDLIYITGNGTVVEAPAETISFEITDKDGYATYFNSQKAFVMPEGVKGGIITSVADNATDVEYLYEAGAVVPAATPIILNGEVKAYQAEVVTVDAIAPTNNLLKGFDANSEKEADDAAYFYYKLSRAQIDGKDCLGFFWFSNDGHTNGSIAGKAYLKLTAEQSSNFFISLENDATGISNATVKADNGDVYSISGMRINGNQLTKGIYIVNGKKMVIR